MNQKSERLALKNVIGDIFAKTHFKSTLLITRNLQKCTTNNNYKKIRERHHSDHN
jgi:hypothetical protein